MESSQDFIGHWTEYSRGKIPDQAVIIFLPTEDFSKLCTTRIIPASLCFNCKYYSYAVEKSDFIKLKCSARNACTLCKLAKHASTYTQ